MPSESFVMTHGLVGDLPIRVVELSSVEWLQPSDDAEWDAFVGQHPYGLVYHLSAWKNVLHRAFPHIRGAVLVLRDNQSGRISAGMPIYTVKSWLLGKRLSSLPFSSFCDPLVTSAEQFQQLLPVLESVLRRSKSRVAEIRSTKTGAYLAETQLDRTSSYKHHYLPLDRDIDEIFRGFAKSSIRQKIQQAERAGVVVKEKNGEEGLKLCHSILAATRSRRALPVLPYAFFRAIGESLGPESLKVFLAYQDGKPVAFHLILRFKDSWISEYSGNTDEAQNGVNQLLYWDTIKRAHGDGATRFSFGRTSSTNEGLLAYKKRWDPIEENLAEFSLYPETESPAKEGQKAPRESTIAYRLMRMLLSKAPVPVSRLIGNYCYRHLG